MSDPQPVQVDGRTLTLSNLEKVMYPEVGFTKGELIDYYARIAPVMLPHLRGRPVTFRRYPDGVEGESFFEKRCPEHRPSWIHTAVGPGSRRGPVRYCLLEDRAGLVWAANLAAIELHVSLARAESLDEPDHVVFDLDPGLPATIVECAQVALEIREILGELGLECLAKTSGSKGLQLYLPLNSPHSYDHTRNFALAIAQLLEARRSGRVTTNMAKAVRSGKVFIDWSQNSYAKTTVCAYAMRALARPTVSTPLSWDEVDECAGGRELVFEATEVLQRVEVMGDLFEPLGRICQQLPERRS